MRFELDETAAAVVHYNGRQEVHGDEKKSAADIKLAVAISNERLGMFAEGLLDALYQPASDGQMNLDAEAKTELRFPQLVDGGVKWAGQMVGAKVTFHLGLNGKSNVVLDGVVVGKFKLAPENGGTVDVEFTVSCHPDERQAGKLATMCGKVPVTVEAPGE